MRPIITAAIAAMLMASAPLYAQSKIGLASQAAMRSHRLQKQGLLRTPSQQPQAQWAGAFVTLADGASASDLEGVEGVTVRSVRGNIALVTVDYDHIEALAALEAVTSLNLSRQVNPALDHARAESGVEAIHQGTDLPKAYTGQGVLTGIYDTGFDIHHPNFANPDGTTRVDMLAHLRMNTAGTALLETCYTSDPNDNNEDIERFTTDNRQAYHGSHTLGIMSGAFTGTVTAATPSGEGAATLTQISNPYYGVATGANIAVGCGDLNDMCIGYGVDYIVSYAEYLQQPCVINLSLGSNLGSHDPNSQMNKFLDFAVEQTGAIICVSAGNEGDMPLAVTKTLTADDPQLKTFLKPTYTEQPTMRYGQAYIYSDTEQEFELQVVIFNQKRGAIAFRLPLQQTQELGTPLYYASSDFSTGSEIVNTNFDKYFSGYLGLARMVDPDTGRYYAMVDFYFADKEANTDSNYTVGFQIDGQAGQRINAWCDGQFTVFSDLGYADKGWSNGTTDGTISDMACGYNTIAVGSYNTRNEWGGLDGHSYDYKEYFPLGDISLFSSWGTLLDGRTLPHICAPGAAIISSTNSYYTSLLQGETDYLFSATATGANGRKYHWQREQGTSMAAPFAAGVIALWLEADPTLTVEQVKDIMAQTATIDEAVTTTGNPVQWGAGKLNPVEGLKEVIRRSQSGISTLNPDADNRLILQQQGGRITLFLSGQKSLQASVTNLAGQTVLTASATGTDTLSLDGSHLAPGVYIISVNHGQHTRKIVI